MRGQGGKNVLKLNISAGVPAGCIIYDRLRLEVNGSAPAPKYISPPASNSPNSGTRQSARLTESKCICKVNLRDTASQVIILSRVLTTLWSSG